MKHNKRATATGGPENSGIEMADNTQHAASVIKFACSSRDVWNRSPVRPMIWFSASSIRFRPRHCGSWLAVLQALQYSTD